MRFFKCWQTAMRVSLPVIMLMLALHLSAQTMTGNAPQQVGVGQQFRLTYTVNTQDVDDFQAGQIPDDAFEVLMGPSVSRQSSFQMVNGRTTQSSSITFTYILSALKNGTFTIPAARITAEGKQITSNAIKIQVSGTAQTNPGRNSGGGGQRQQPAEEAPRAAGSKITGSDLFIKVSASKRRVVEQEPVLLTYKVYTLVDLTQLDGKMPDLKGFHTQEIPLPQQKSFKIEQLNGRNYRTVTWSQYVMFPQQTGKLTVPGITFNGIVLQQNRSIDPFEAFFNGGSGYVEVKKQIQAPGIEIEVDPLPQRPAGFSGGVGRFSVSATIDRTDVKSNDPITVRVVVSGVGNLKLIKEPVVDFPKDFDRYDVKVTDKTRLTTSGVEGSMIYEYLAVPRHQGQYDVPPVSFIYYDTENKAYKTVTTEGFRLNVAKGEGESTPVQDFTGMEDVKELAKDIRHIRLGDTHLMESDGFFFGSSVYLTCIVVLALIFISLFVVFRQRAIENADIVKVRAGKANKVATKRLKKASRLMQEGRSEAFYDEVMRALWGYVGDKLNIDVAQLSQDNIREKLSERQVDEATVSEFVEALSECEFVRYAPGDAIGNMNKVYTKAMTAIEKIESVIKKSRRRNSRTSSVSASVLLLVTMLFAPVSLQPTIAVEKAAADSAYSAGDYVQAIADYETLLKEGVSADLYYNLGNAYYRTDDITHAILNYERALLLSPGDGDVKFNLQIARSKTVDKINPESEMFFVTWYRSLVNQMSVDGWARLALASLALVVILALVYLFADAVWLRKVGFFGGVVLLLVFVLSNVFAFQQRQNFLHRNKAIIMLPAVSVKSTPMTNGTDLFILHEGTKVTIVDASMSDWKEVRVADGKRGWIETSSMETI